MDHQNFKRLLVESWNANCPQGWKISKFNEKLKSMKLSLKLLSKETYDALECNVQSKVNELFVGIVCWHVTSV